MLETLKEAERALLEFVPKLDTQKAKYTLGRMRAFMDLLGNPQDGLKVIHVAGTSGKTSTCYFLAELLRQAGLKVGLTVSPHIDKITERIQLNGQPMSDEKFTREIERFIKLAKDSEINLTYFELLMAFAYSSFASEKVDVAVIETGLGGLLDASNVVNSASKTCVITDIGLDHTGVLGNRLEEIAAQKAGIILPGNEVFMLEQPPAIVNVIRQKSAQSSATLNMLREQGTAEELPLFQRRNFSLAEQTAQAWLEQNGLPSLSAGQILASSKVTIPGRMEVLKADGKTVVIDGAHNAQKMQAFVKSFQSMFPDQKAAVLLAVKTGKDHGGLLEALLPVVDRLVITSFSASQDMPISSIEPSELAEACDKLGFNNYEVIKDLSTALQKVSLAPNKLAVVVGSLYLTALVRPMVSGFSAPENPLKDHHQ